MPDEVLDVLYRTHDERSEVGKRKRSMSRGPVRAREKGRKTGRASDVGWLGSSQRRERCSKLCCPATDKVRRCEREKGSGKGRTRKEKGADDGGKGKRKKEK
jgi:hypothetical protein